MEKSFKDYINEIEIERLRKNEMYRLINDCKDMNDIKNVLKKIVDKLLYDQDFQWGLIV